jgi:hypothetical protein
VLQKEEPAKIKQEQTKKKERERELRIKREKEKNKNIFFSFLEQNIMSILMKDVSEK